MSAPYFDLVLTPNRSLAPRHARWLAAGIGVALGLVCLRALLLGAWPVLPFAVMDATLLWWAFRASYRSGQARESIRLDDTGLVVDDGTRRVRLEPFWTKAGIEDRRLWLAERQRQVSIGAFLSPDERREVYGIIVAGLARWRERRAP